MGFNIVQAFVSVLLFFVLFFGISFIVNMLFRKTWVMAIVYPVIIIFIIDNIGIMEYFTAPSTSVQTAWGHLIRLTIVDGVILSSGLIGVLVSGIVIRTLRARGYQMF